ncbi:MAG: Maf family protein [Lacipirellulaceae bacterium]
MSSVELVLASGSPRRRELLVAAGYAPRVVPPRPGAEECGLCTNCGPAELVIDLADRKLRDVLDRFAVGEASPPAAGAVVLAADTVAECGGTILGKPADEAHARQMLRSLSGREHRVYTGIALAVSSATGPGPITRLFETTVLTMDPLSDQWIDDYVESGAWEGKAGAFGYQDGLGFVHVLRGSESNVVGLPMEVVRRLLASRGCFLTPDGEG